MQKEVVRPGYHRQIFGYETVRTFRRDVQAVEFTNDASERGTDHRTMSAINVPTVDGYPVALDVTAGKFQIPWELPAVSFADHNLGAEGLSEVVTY